MIISLAIFLVACNNQEKADANFWKSLQKAGEFNKITKKVDIISFGRDLKTTKLLYQQSPQEVTGKLGGFLCTGQTTYQVKKGKKEISLKEEMILQMDSQGNFHFIVSNQRDLALEVIQYENRAFTREKYAKFREISENKTSIMLNHWFLNRHLLEMLADSVIIIKANPKKIRNKNIITYLYKPGPNPGVDFSLKEWQKLMGDQNAPVKFPLNQKYKDSGKDDAEEEKSVSVKIKNVRGTIKLAIDNKIIISDHLQFTLLFTISPEKMVEIYFSSNKKISPKSVKIETPQVFWPITDFINPTMPGDYRKEFLKKSNGFQLSLPNKNASLRGKEK